MAWIPDSNSSFKLVAVGKRGEVLLDETPWELGALYLRIHAHKYFKNTYSTRHYDY